MRRWKQKSKQTTKMSAHGRLRGIGCTRFYTPAETGPSTQQAKFGQQSLPPPRCICGSCEGPLCKWFLPLLATADVTCSLTRRLALFRVSADFYLSLVFFHVFDELLCLQWHRIPLKHKLSAWSCFVKSIGAALKGLLLVLETLWIDLINHASQSIPHCLQSVPDHTAS